MAGTIDSMGVEIRNQIEDIPAYVEYLLSLPKPPKSEVNGANCIFIGAGDSFAAALATEHLTAHSARSLDPYEVCRKPFIVTDMHLYVISVSGRTMSNIEAVKAARRFAREVTAITANRNSLLAKYSHNLIELKYRSEGRLTPGTNGFTSSLLACYSRVRPLPKLSSLSDMYDEALSWSQEIRIPVQSTTFITGTGLTYPLAIYGKAKIYEVLGSKAQSQRTEQFNHMELFSLTRDDLTIVIPESEDDVQATRLHALLKENLFKTALLPPRNQNEVDNSLRITMHLQVLAWKTARNLGMEECAFINRPDLLRISDEMIYPKRTNPNQKLGGMRVFN